MKNICLLLALVSGLYVFAGQTHGWYFEEGSGTTAGDSVGSDDGDIKSGVTWNDDPKVGSYALSFSGSNASYVDLGNILSFDYNSSFSFSFWIRGISDSDGYRVIASKMTSGDKIEKGWIVALNDNKLEFILRADSGDGPSATTKSIEVKTNSAITGRDWIHMAVTYDGSGSASGVTIYVEGVSKNLKTIHDNLASNATTNSVNARLGGFDDPADKLGYAGDLDEFRTYDHELTAGEVDTLSLTPVMRCAQVKNIIDENIQLDVPDDFATIQDALDCLATKQILSNAIVTIKVADGTYTYTSGIAFTHQNGNQIHIIGNTTNHSACTIQFNTTDNAVNVHSAILGQLDGFTLKNIGSAGIGLAVWYGTALCGENLTFDGFNEGVLSSYNSYVDISGVEIKNSTTYGIRCSFTSTVAAPNTTITNNGTDGVLCQNTASVNVNNATITNNGRAGIYARYLGNVSAYGATLSGNTSYGVLAGHSSNIDFQSASVTGGTYGIRSENGSFINATSTTVTSATTSYSPAVNTNGNWNSYIRQ